MSLDTPCPKPDVHERMCRHAFPKWRVEHVDGCTLHWCSACAFNNIDDADEIASLALIDRDGIPLYARDQTAVEAMCNALLRTPVMPKVDP